VLHEVLEVAVDLVDLGNFLLLNGFFLLESFQQFAFFFSLDLKVVGLSSELLEARVESFAVVLGDTFLAFGLVKLSLDDLELVLLALLALFLLLDLDLLLLFLLGQRLEILPK
jgi:hypothetical protein